MSTGGKWDISHGLGRAKKLQQCKWDMKRESEKWDR